MKPLFLKALLLPALLACMSFSVVVHHPDVTTEAYDSGNIAKVQWPGNGRVNLVMTAGSAVELDASTFSHLAFKATQAGMDTPAADAAAAITLTGSTLQAASAITLLDMEGRTVAASASGTLSLDGVHAGAYVATSREGSLKILVTNSR